MLWVSGVRRRETKQNGNTKLGHWLRIAMHSVSRYLSLILLLSVFLYFSFFLLSSHPFFRTSSSYSFFLLHGITSQRTVIITDRAVSSSHLKFLLFQSILVPISISFSHLLFCFSSFLRLSPFFLVSFSPFYPYNSALPASTPISFLFFSYFTAASPR